jgi:hypothetical protein
MLQAFLKGKLSREQENLEDILTSSVFGALVYAPGRALLSLLALATYDDGTPVLEFQSSRLKMVSAEFWPTYRCQGVGATEPDIVIELEDMLGRRQVVLVEVKLNSGKSSSPIADSIEIGDQLAREWCVLIERCRGSGSQPHLLYVTADPRYPELDVRESQREFESKRAALAREFPFRCAWISWSKIATAFREVEDPVLRDISMVCERLDLVPFAGISGLSTFPLSWRFSPKEMRFRFSCEPITLSWSYR